MAGGGGSLPQREEEGKMIKTAAATITWVGRTASVVFGREAMPKAPPSGPKLRGHAASTMVFLMAVLVLLWVLVALLTRAGYLLPLPPMPY
jgi:hypothetical protein